MPRNTRTGAVLESMILPSLHHGGYKTTPQVNIGSRPAGRRHFVDVIAEKDDKRILVSLKYQDTGGTAEEKVPYELICMLHAVRSYGFDKAYIVLGGIGWTLRDWFVGDGLRDYIEYRGVVEIVTLEQFIAIANKGRL